MKTLTMAMIAVSLAAGAATAETDVNQPTGPVMMRRMKHEQRLKAAVRAHKRHKENEKAGRLNKKGAPGKKAAGLNGVKGAAAELVKLAIAQVPAVDLYASPNYALSKLPVATCLDTTGAVTSSASGVGTSCQKDSDCSGYDVPFMVGINQFPGGSTCTGSYVSGGIKKFKDSLAPLCLVGGSTLNQNCIPLASPDQTKFAGADYYEIGLKDYSHQFHSDIPASKQRGYYQKNPNSSYPLYDAKAAQNSYLGPLIIGVTNRPVRVKFTNELGVTGDGSTGPGAEGKLFIPMDGDIAGVGFGPDGVTKYSENRATLHLHGGNTPWISDGTQHQWTTPVGETNKYKKGVSVENVPDMEIPGDGQLNFYWPNQQSGRMMFYHDHAYGITRLNVYSGEAAGYVLVNPPDEDALAAAGVPGTLATALDVGHLIPLVIQDRTFVPPAAQLAEQDPTWDVAKWGGEGSVWFPHVYTPNQWPGNPDNSNTNPFGRWDYGPWFHPAQTTLTTVDSAGKATLRPLLKPCTSVAAITATNPNGDTECPTTPEVSLVPEAFMDTPVINGVAYPTLEVEPRAYRFMILNAANERNLNLSFFVSDTSTTEVELIGADLHTPTMTGGNKLCTKTAAVDPVTGLPKGCWPIDWPADSRQGGVPSPWAAGPKWIQLGSEAGLLPAPAIIPPMPVGYEANKRNIVVLNVSTKGLFMGPAERADLVVDFSAYQGKTLILYNDAPAPVPAGDPRQDYYTGAPDFTANGGAPTVLPGYGPNMRTIMQVKVKGAATGTVIPVDMVKLTAALKAQFIASQPKPIVPEAAYNSIYDPAVPFTNKYLPITQVAPVTVTPIGSATPVTIPVPNKALHELFTTDFGRMNSLLGVEVPLTNWVNQTTIPFSNFDPTTEFVEDNKPQIWRITHNGVDTHTIHFHLLNVQIINRVGWDGQIRAPDANELGWKESVRMNPLEDIFVALQPIKQSLPWPMPDKWRPLDVDRAVGSASQFTGVDVNNNPINVTNDVTNFGQEYVWHCHLLGHEEEDMLRAEVFVVAPEVPTMLSAVGADPVNGPVALTWQDNSKSAMSFTVQRSTVPDFSSNVVTLSDTVAAPGFGPSQVSFVDASSTPGVLNYYRVLAGKSLYSPAFAPAQQGSKALPYVAVSAYSNVIQFPAPTLLVSPAALAFGGVALTVPATSVGKTVTLTNNGPVELLVGGITLSGVSAAEFTTSNDCAGVVPAAGGFCTVTVVFAPTSEGAKSATLTIASNAQTSPAIIPITGTGVAPIAGASVGTLAFGNVLLGTTAGPQTLTLTNQGNADLTVLGIGTSGAGFAQTNDCVTVAANGGTCTVSVTFAPAALGAVVGSVVLVTNDPLNGTISISLTGTGVAPNASVSPGALAFGNQGPNTQSAAQLVTLTNSGTADLLNIAITPSDAVQFPSATTCGTTLAAGTSCTISVAFKPATPGVKAASIGITTSDKSFTIGLSGTGAGPVLVVTPGALSFTSLPNVSTAAQAVTVTNAGTSNLRIASIAVVGTGFTRANGCGGTLAAGASCTVNVTFRSTTSQTATLNVTVNAPAVSASVALTGTVIVPTFTLAPAPLAFGSVARGTASAAQTVTLTNTTSLPITVTSVASSGDFSQTNTCVGAGPLAPNASCTAAVTFAPTGRRLRTGNLTFRVTGAANGVVALTGTGL